MLSNILVNPYKCFPGRCPSFYGPPISGNTDRVALACSIDPKCVAFRHSTKHGFGYLCGESDAMNSYDDWVLCKIDPGELSFQLIF